ncbi:MAG: hypothetical protein N3D82_03055 [Ignisphaera sp.]|nr:hypothetical protein [Ignisphaera sp.]MCX8167994.1 hypothetical protein [Ignisphaera sp.]
MGLKVLCRDDILKHFLNHSKLLMAISMKRFIVLTDKEYGLRVYVFKGVDRDYLVSPCSMCTCSDFIINFVGKKRDYPCYHVIGFAIAERQNRLSYVELDHSTLVAIISEIVFLGFSTRLRKIIKS